MYFASVAPADAKGGDDDEGEDEAVEEPEVRACFQPVPLAESLRYERCGLRH
jgi:hypothetical protein